jgi:hypothetical protein
MKGRRQKKKAKDKSAKLERLFTAEAQRGRRDDREIYSA